MRQHPKDWRNRLSALEKIDWSRSNARTWEGRALIGGKVSKVTTNVLLTTNVIKKALSLPLDEDEQRVETANRKGGR
jgi:DNA sulfur modification protein DndB